jgi:hypothetical protein
MMINNNKKILINFKYNFKTEKNLRIFSWQFLSSGKDLRDLAFTILPFNSLHRFTANNLSVNVFVHLLFSSIDDEPFPSTHTYYPPIEFQE